MRYIKKFESYAAEPKVAPATPKTKPGTRPSRPNPIRRHKPAVDPKPKAELDDVLNLLAVTATEDFKKELDDHYGKENK